MSARLPVVARDWPPFCAPAPLRRAHIKALHELATLAAESIGAAAQYRYAESLEASGRAGFAGLRCAVLAPLVDLLGGHPPLYRYASAELRREAKRFRTGHSARRARWEARG